MAKRLDVALVVDVEATCWDGKVPDGMVSEIIEIGLATLDMKTLEVLEKRSFLIEPERSEVSAFCTELTTITPQMLQEHGVSLAHACEVLRQEYHANKRVWMSWGDYDRAQFVRECELKGLRYPFGRWHVNLKTLYALVNGDSREMGMAGALRRSGIELQGVHHRGVDDAGNIATLAAKVFGAHRGLPHSA